MKQSIVSACRRALTPLVRFLLRNGMKWKEFQDLSKAVYVDVARQDYGVQGRPTNNARVAMLTGLSRREVAKVREALGDADELVIVTEKSRITEILTGWHTDPDFLDGNGKPRRLAENDDGDGPLFGDLLRRYAGDLPHIALTKEMLQAGVMEADGKGHLQVLKRDYVHATLSDDLIEYMGQSLHDHATTLDYNLNPDKKGPARFERRATNHFIERRHAKALYALVETTGLEFLENVDGWLARHEVNDTTEDDGVRMGVGVYLFHDPLRKGRSS
ncbi:MAG: DUF6502 family protein [Pseudomonadota bacterium]